MGLKKFAGNKKKYSIETSTLSLDIESYYEIHLSCNWTFKVIL